MAVNSPFGQGILQDHLVIGTLLNVNSMNIKDLLD